MSEKRIHPTIASEYDVVSGFVQKLSIPGIGYRDLALTPLQVVKDKIEKGIIPGLKKKETLVAEATEAPKKTSSKKSSTETK